MKINIKTKNFELTDPIERYIEQKIRPLEKFINLLYNDERSRVVSSKFKESVQVFIEVGKETRHHKKGPHFRAEIQITFSGKSVRTKSRSEDLFVAINKVKDELQRELKHSKAKSTARRQRKARAVKKDIKISPQARFFRKGRIRQEGT
jgi:ribosomal subunit interface protein